MDAPFDALVAGVHAPKSDNFYQASRAATYAGLAARPALADGGLLVVCADLPDGAGPGPGERNFAALLAASPSPAELVARGLREPLGPGGQRAFVVARVLERYRIAVVGAARAGLPRSRSAWPRSTPSTRPWRPRTPGSVAARACSPWPTPWRPSSTRARRGARERPADASAPPPPGIM